MIEVTNLKKTYETVHALLGVDFKIQPGEIVGLLGPNGAGKTTIIKTLTGYLQPDEGVVTVDGLDILINRKEVQKKIGYLPESAPLYGDMTILEYLKMMAGLRQIPVADEMRYIEEAAEAVGLLQRMNQPIGQLSKGYRQRVGLAQAILHKPEILILDEPTVGLDPTQILEIRKLIKKLAQNTTILFSTHILSEVEALCDRVIILINGDIKVDAPLADLARTNDALLTLEETVEDVIPVLSELNGVEKIEILPSAEGHAVYRILADDGIDLCPNLYSIANKHKWPVRELQREVQDLETVFNRLALAT